MSADDPVAEPQPVPSGAAMQGSVSCDGGHLGPAGGSCQGGCSDCRDEVCLSWFGQCVANTEVFVLGDAFKTVGDATGSIGSIDNSFGMRLVANTGIPLKDLPFQGQFGVSYGGYDWRGRIDLGGLVPGSSIEKQMFATAGLFQRSDIEYGERISWGIVFDEMVVDQWGFLGQDFTLGQFRGVVGYALNECHEIGLRGAFGIQPATALTFVLPSEPDFTVKPSDYLSAFWHTHWESGADTTVFAGVVNRSDIGSWLAGIDLRSPLNDRTSSFASLTYVAPSAAAGSLGVGQEHWNLSIGLCFSFGSKAAPGTVSGAAGMPLLNVADNGSFIVTN